MRRIVVVSGGRNYEKEGMVFATLAGLMPIDEIHEGGCPTGADKFARNFAAINCVALITHEPDWDAYGKSAGPRRNASMIQKCKNEMDKGHEVIAVFFPGGKGTDNCFMNAKNKELTIIDNRNAR